MSRLSCVKVEKDKTTQHFYTYNFAGKKPINILPDLVSIGYYDWISQNEFLSFELPEPFYLVRHNIQSNKKIQLPKTSVAIFIMLETRTK